MSGQGIFGENQYWKLEYKSFLRWPKCGARRENVLKTYGTKIAESEKVFFRRKVVFLEVFSLIFDRLPERVGGGGAKSHSAGAPWWIMKVI